MRVTLSPSYCRTIKLAILQDNKWYHLNENPKVVGKLVYMSRRGDRNPKKVWIELSQRYKWHLTKLWELEKIREKLSRF